MASNPLPKMPGGEPPLDSAFISRIAQAPVVTLIAPAGFGKTATLRRWAHALAGQGSKVHFLCASTATQADLAAAALAGAGATLIIDDAHLLPSSAAEALAAFFNNPEGVRVMLASRGVPPVPLARLRMQHAVLELGVQDLTPSRAELAAQLADPSPRLLEEIIQETAFWPAAIALATRPGMLDAEGSLKRARLRRELDDYFAEDVFSQHPALCDFLGQASILSPLTPLACAALLNEPKAAVLLSSAFQSGLFLCADDVKPETYWIHPCFRDALQRRLHRQDPNHIAALHRRAAEYFTGEADLKSALHHAALTGDECFLATLLEQAAETLIYGGQMACVASAMRQLAPATLAARPMLLLTLAWQQARQLAYADSEASIAQAEHLIAALPSGEPATKLQRILRHRRLILAIARDDLITVERESEALLADFGKDEPDVAGSLLAPLISARRELYRMQDALELQAEARSTLARNGSDFSRIVLKCAIAPTLVTYGRVEAASLLLTDALAHAEAIAGPGSGIAALPALRLAELRYETGDLAGAAALVTLYFGAVGDWGFVDQFLAGHLIRARLFEADADLPRALGVLEEARLVSLEGGLDRLRAGITAEQVRLLLKLGQPEDAERLFTAAALCPRDTPPLPGKSASRRDELAAAAWIRLETAAGRTREAAKLARQWRNFVKNSCALQSAMHFELLLARIAITAGDSSTAFRALRDALAIAAPAGWVRAFLDEGKLITGMVLEAYANGPALPGPIDHFAQLLVRSIRGTPQPQGRLQAMEEPIVLDHLAAREIQVLAMVSGGLRNREIGCRLGLTENTVKWYMQQIYDKLGVHRRPQAVERARQLGLLA